MPQPACWMPPLVLLPAWAFCAWAPNRLRMLPTLAAGFTPATTSTRLPPWTAVWSPQSPPLPPWWWP
ncbi:hypothetical protein ACFQV8_29625 [Pseudonocardia benzenivorans]